MEFLRTIKIFIGLFALVFWGFVSYSQEILCRVDVSYNQDKIPDMDPSIIEKIKEVSQEFINNRRWTEHSYEEEEKIELNVAIQIISKSGDSYTSSIQFQSFRPVYNSNYKSIVFSFLEKKVVFEFKEYETVEYDDNTFRSNLTSTLAFYSYFAIALDYDTFEKKGGTEYYRKAQNVAQNAITAGAWRNDDDSQFSMADDLLHSSFDGFRLFLYKYHREGLDVMEKSAENGRKAALASLNDLYISYKKSPSSRLFDVLFHAKSREMIDIFSEANQADKKTASDLLSKMNPANIAEYQKLK